MQQHKDPHIRCRLHCSSPVSSRGRSPGTASAWTTPKPEDAASASKVPAGCGGETGEELLLADVLGVLAHDDA
jgi:hypothetical protein